MLGERQLYQILDRLPNERLAIAFSGGGDSMALVHLCRQIRPKPLILIVDHALRTGSDNEARQAFRFAANLGLDAQILTWNHGNPKTGIQEKARRGRYGLMGEVCRMKGIRYLLTAHTRDDQAETLFMRYERRTGWRGAAGMSEKVYAPVWPELAKVTLVRPLLHVTRTKLRDYNELHSLKWVEDPSNDNEVFERIRTRQHLALRPGLVRHLLREAEAIKVGVSQELGRIAEQVERFVTIDENGIALVTGPLSLKTWEYLLLAVGGGDKPISEHKLKRVQEIAANATHNGTTLGGARLRRHGRDLVVGADPGPYVGRNNVAPIADQLLHPGEGLIWGGRFEISAFKQPFFVTTTHNLFDKAESVLRVRELKNLMGTAPAGKDRFNSTMPYILDENGILLSSIFENRDAGYFRSIVENRLHGFLRIKNQ